MGGSSTLTFGDEGYQLALLPEDSNIHCICFPVLLLILSISYSLQSNDHRAH